MEQIADRSELDAYIDARIKRAISQRISERLAKQNRLSREAELVDEKLNETVSRRLREAREFADLKQQVAAQRIGYQNSGALSKMENWQAHADRAIPVALIARAAILYGVSADYLLGLTDWYENDRDALFRRFMAQSVLNTWEQAREEDLALLMRTVDDVSEVQAALVEINRHATELRNAINYMREKNKVFPTDPEERPEGFDELLGANKVLTEAGRVSTALSNCISKLRSIKMKTIRPTRAIHKILQARLDEVIP